MVQETPDDVTAEYLALRAGVANVTLAWAGVENLLVELLASVLGKDDLTIPSAMYFSLTGIESRVRLVDRAFRSRFDTVPNGLRVLPAWENAMATATRLRKVRNKVAHGQIIFAIRNLKSYPRLTSPSLDLSFRAAAAANGQLPGLSANDLAQSCEAVGALQRKLRLFVAFTRADSASDETASRGIADELAGSCAKEEGPGDSLNQRTP